MRRPYWRKPKARATPTRRLSIDLGEVADDENGPLEPGTARHLPQRNALGRARPDSDLGDLSDHDGVTCEVARPCEGRSLDSASTIPETSRIRKRPKRG